MLRKHESNVVAVRCVSTSYSIYYIYLSIYLSIYFLYIYLLPLSFCLQGALLLEQTQRATLYFLFYLLYLSIYLSTFYIYLSTSPVLLLTGCAPAGTDPVSHSCYL
jgi:hypothetical protein